MTTRQLGTGLAAASAWLVAIIFLDSSGVLDPDAEVAVDNFAQLTAGVAAAVLCLARARHVEGPERTWRWLMGIGMAGWSVGQVIWSYGQVFADTPLPSPGPADVGYLTLPVFALPALLALAIGNPELPDPGAGRTRAWLVLTLDGLIVVASLFTVTWATALGAVVHSSESLDRLGFLVAVAYPATDLALVVIVVLLAVTRRVPSALHRQLWLLGSGLVMISASDSIFAYIVATGGETMPPVTNAGFIAGPLLIAIAALVPADEPEAVDAPEGVGVSDADGRAGRTVAPADRRVERVHLFLPYALVVLMTLVVLVQYLVDGEIDRVERWTVGVVVGMVLIRQLVTLVENEALLARLRATQEELAYRAQHDPLTGLANRDLFNDRLSTAMARHRAHGRPYSLVLVDLDDFKAVNDRYGHTTGDRLLRAVGNRIRGCVRDNDTVARLGGDEFAVVLEGLVDSPRTVGDRILDALSTPFVVDGRQLRVGASIGLVEPTGDEIDLTADAVMRRADGALYVGKARGKGVAVEYRPELVAEITGNEHVL
ncbi:MAG TPA: GGDEF domain-containing protein [Acidimicrobiales bacterium]